MPWPWIRRIQDQPEGGERHVVVISVGLSPSLTLSIYSIRHTLLEGKKANTISFLSRESVLNDPFLALHFLDKVSRYYVSGHQVSVLIFCICYYLSLAL